MMDGVYAAYTKQSGEPFGVVAPHDRLTELMKAGARVGCCRVCMELRGIGEGEISEGIEVSGLFDLSESIESADSVLSFVRRG